MARTDFQAWCSRCPGGEHAACILLICALAGCEASTPRGPNAAATATGAQAGGALPEPAGTGGSGSGGRGTGGRAGAQATGDDGLVPADAGAGGPTDAGLDDGGSPTANADRCDVAVYDASAGAAAPGPRSLTGNLGTHDPTLIFEDGLFHLFQTGPRIPGKTSTDLRNWLGTPPALGDSNPSWVADAVPGARDLWAPDISYFGGRYHLYYSASTFGSNDSCIGHAVRDSLGAGGWQDLGAAICSSSGGDNFNAIDPNVVVDAAGTPWMFFGSFWSGIKAVRLTADGARADDAVHDIASRGGDAIEAPVVVRRCGYYYLFVSFGRCCSGVDSTYHIRVGRSQAVLGPYVDRDGVAMMRGGGSTLVEGDARYRGPGHNAVIFHDGAAYNVYHAYDATAGGAPVLRVSELVWDAAGWPVPTAP